MYIQCGKLHPPTLISTPSLLVSVTILDGFSVVDIFANMCGEGSRVLRKLSDRRYDNVETLKYVLERRSAVVN